MSDDLKPDKLEFARRLRRNLTYPERLLWSRLRNRRLAGHKFVRQVPIGTYIVDFLCREQFLIIELDGTSHDDNGVYDQRREERIKAASFRVLRFSNDDVLQGLDDVLEGILKALGPAVGDIS
jgi:very-short-patch-repair endonuclease